ncbi:MAG: S-layer homology domain-containing protein [Bacillota bacterium]|nr:S-layer homology domain-containing protein [Bacillota bacterium]
MNISIMNRKRVSALLTAALVFLAVIIFTSPSAQAYENLSPKALNLYTVSDTENADSIPGLHLSFSNDTALFRKTAGIIKELEEKGYTYTGLSLQVQLKTDDESWKTYKTGYFGSIEADDTVSDIIISDMSGTNLSEHTVYAKIRYAWTYEGGAYYGTWSEAAAAGKNASAAVVPEKLSYAPSFTDVSLDFSEDEYPQFNITFDALPEDAVSNMTNPKGTLMLNVMISENGKEFRNIRFQQVSNIKSGQVLQCSILDPEKGYESGTVTMKARFEWYTGGTTYYGTKTPDVVSPWSVEKTENVELWSKASGWAEGELKKAEVSGLIPVTLMGNDLTKSITRAEFAATAVKTYEKLSGKTAVPVSESPFTDCSDEDVLKAYALGIVNGISADSFAPNEYLNREQAAVMMTRVYKIINIKDWSLETDGDFSLEYTAPEKFMDDPLISAYAKDSVYFMASNGVINGIGNNLFAPKNTTQTEKKKGYANATRQQSILIAVRMTEAF